MIRPFQIHNRSSLCSPQVKRFTRDSTTNIIVVMGTMLTLLLLIAAIFAIIIILVAGFLLHDYWKSRNDPNHWLTCGACGKNVYVGPAVSDMPDYENYRCSGCSDLQKDM